MLTQGIEDQLSVGFVENGQLMGLSINRDRWGFGQRDKQVLTRMAACTFSLYRALPDPADQAGDAVLVLDQRRHLERHRALPGLTPRQTELLGLVARGLSNKQIAGTLSLSEGTVRKHLENAFRRLGVGNRVAAISRAARLIEER